MGTKRKTAKTHSRRKPADKVVVSSAFLAENSETPTQRALHTNLKWLRANAKPLLLLGLCVMLAVVGAVWLQHSGTMPAATHTNTGRLTPAQVDAQVATEQIGSLQQRIKLTKDQTEKYSDEAELSAIYYSQGRYADALELAKDVEANKPTAASAGALGDIYLAQDNHTDAVHFYTLARNRSQQPSSSNARSPYNDYSLKLQQAQGSAQ